MISADKLNEGLAQFYGSENWYRYSRMYPKILLTDGTKWLAENGFGWLCDLICSYQNKCLKDEMLRDFQLWVLKVDLKTKKAVVTCERDTNDVFLKQKIPYTDCPIPEIKLYVEPMGDGQFCILLTSEH